VGGWTRISGYGQDEPTPQATFPPRHGLSAALGLDGTTRWWRRTLLIPIQSSLLRARGHRRYAGKDRRCRARSEPALKILGVVITCTKRTALARDIREPIQKVFAARC